MTWLRVLPMVVACGLTAAHLYRWDLWPQALLALLAPLLLLTRTPSVVLPLQWMLGVFALEWVRTAWVLVAARMQEGQPTARMLAILLGVALMTLLAALPLGRLKRDWETDRPSSRQEGDS
jgi:hypothetical protein